jgi:uncharacterized membrane protein YeaQ/YmgE (transglycosylase-associated protein family)
MTLIGVLVLLLIAAICGSLGQSMVGYSAGGCLVSIIVGFIGAWLGLWLAGELHLPAVGTINIEGHPFPILWSIIGSALFAGILGIINRAIRGR